MLSSPRNPLTLGVAMLWLCSCATRTPPAPAPSADEKSAAAENVEQTLMQMERDWMDAFVKQDAAARGRILADDWAGISWDGQLSDKAKSIVEMPLGTTGPVTMDPMKVRVFGDVAG